MFVITRRTVSNPKTNVMITYKRLQLMFILVSIAIFLLPGCKEDKDPCDDTKWESKVNYSVQPKLLPANAVLPDGKVLKEANNMIFKGVVKKYHCGGSFAGQTQPIPFLFGHRRNRMPFHAFWNRARCLHHHRADARIRAADVCGQQRVAG